MANIKLLKKDLKGPLWVGHGWLSAVGWATRVGDDTRLQSAETLGAAFAGLDIQAMPEQMANILETYVDRADPFGGCPRLRRTPVLLEDEDGTITRLYRDTGDLCVGVNLNYLRILGEPPALNMINPFTLVCEAGVVGKTTAETPEWLDKAKPTEFF